MSTSSVHADAFFRELGPDGLVWSIEDDEGVPAPRGTDGACAMPFWSRESRARRVIENVPAYAGFRTREISARSSSLAGFLACGQTAC